MRGPIIIGLQDTYGVTRLVIEALKTAGHRVEEIPLVTGPTRTEQNTLTLEEFGIVEFPFALQDPPGPVVHGPQRKGRGGKQRRW
jgi:hypothetical protein